MSKLSETWQATSDAWNRFWFTPASPEPLCLIRIAVGALLAYAHLVWAIGSTDFFGPASWLNEAAVAAIQPHWAAHSFLWWFDQSPTLMAGLHLLAVANALCLMLGLYTRATSIVGFALYTAFVHRNPAALYGFDQVVAFLAMYLTLGRAGVCWSLDNWEQTADRDKLAVTPDIGSNIALRLTQLHLCVLYLFAGASKLKGTTWWNGSALWGGIANAEYQTLDITWLANFPTLINVLTHLTLAWEVTYIVLIWHPRFRPVMLSLAVLVHLGIGTCFGMMTFCLAMLVANSSFCSPAWARQVVAAVSIAGSRLRDVLSRFEWKLAARRALERVRVRLPQIDISRTST